MDAIRDKDRLILVMDDEQVRTFEYHGRQALVVGTNEQLEELVSQGKSLGHIEALKKPSIAKELPKETVAKTASQANPNLNPARPAFTKDIATASLKEVGKYLYRMKDDVRAKKIIEQRYGKVTMDFVVHCKGEKELKDLLYALV